MARRVASRPSVFCCRNANRQEHLHGWGCIILASKGLRLSLKREPEGECLLFIGNLIINTLVRERNEGQRGKVNLDLLRCS